MCSAQRTGPPRRRTRTLISDLAARQSSTMSYALTAALPYPNVAADRLGSVAGRSRISVTPDLKLNTQPDSPVALEITREVNELLADKTIGSVVPGVEELIRQVFAEGSNTPSAVR
jgi:hypothetical protein